LRRYRRRLVPLQPDVPHARRWQQLEHGIQHSQPGAENRNDDDVAGDAPALRLFEWRLDDRTFGRKVAQSLGYEQHADAIGDASKFFGRGVRVSQLAQGIVDQRVRDDMNGHGPALYITAM
jgi:hypothetical protein